MEEPRLVALVVPSPAQICARDGQVNAVANSAPAFESNRFATTGLTLHDELV